MNNYIQQIILNTAENIFYTHKIQGYVTQVLKSFLYKSEGSMDQNPAWKIYSISKRGPECRKTPTIQQRAITPLRTNPKDHLAKVINKYREESLILK